MKTYLLVYDNECQRCNNRWTSSFTCNTWASILSPFIKVERIAGFFHRKEKHQACFACIERDAVPLPLPFGTREATPRPTPAKVEIDLLGD